MDDDSADLIRKLCTRAGMIMEDVSARAICLGGLPMDDLTAVVAEIEKASQDIGALAAGAKVLMAR